MNPNNEVKVITTVVESAELPEQQLLDSTTSSNSTAKPVATEQIVEPKQEATEDVKPYQHPPRGKDKKPRKKPGYSVNGVKLGRPANDVVKAAKLPVGRPKGDKSVIAEYKQRMIASPKSAKVLEAVLDAASDKDHKNFTAAAKLVMDRLLPVSSFEEAREGGGRSSVNITITNVDGSKTVIGEDIEDADYTEEADDNNSL